MERLKILFITKDYSQWITKNYIYFIEKLSEYTEVKVWHDAADIRYILKKLDFQPDFILLNDFRPHMLPKITRLSSINIPLGIIIEDLHREIEEGRKFINENNIKNVFSISRDKFYKSYPNYKHDVYWFPHWVNTDVFKDYGLEKDIDYLLMGAIVQEHYPLRKLIIDKMQNETGFIYNKHPGYKNIKDNNALIGEKYAREINRAKIFFTDGGIYNYPVKKYYEVLACKTLLLAPTFKELEDLGFIPDVNFVAINGSDFLEKAKFYLEHKEEREKITENGYNMVRSKHSTEMRVIQFVKTVQDILIKNHIYKR